MERSSVGWTGCGALVSRGRRFLPSAGGELPTNHLPSVLLSLCWRSLKTAPFVTAARVTRHGPSPTRARRDGNSARQLGGFCPISFPRKPKHGDHAERAGHLATFCAARAQANGQLVG